MLQNFKYEIGSYRICNNNISLEPLVRKTQGFYEKKSCAFQEGHSGIVINL